MIFFHFFHTFFYIPLIIPPPKHKTTQTTMPPPTHHRAFSSSDTLESLSALLTQLYTLHLLLPSSFPIHSSTPSSLYISQPPHSPSPSLLSKWKETGMSEIVMETLRGLPYLSSRGGGEGNGEGNTEGNREGGSGNRNREIAPDTLALDYLDEDGDAVEVWKDPFCLTEAGGKGKQQRYLGNAIPLTSCIGVEGCLLLLDLDSSMLFSSFLLFLHFFFIFFLFLDHISFLLRSHLCSPRTPISFLLKKHISHSLNSYCSPFDNHQNEK
jgi:hypothetical protein